MEKKSKQVLWTNNLSKFRQNITCEHKSNNQWYSLATGEKVDAPEIPKEKEKIKEEYEVEANIASMDKNDNVSYLFKENIKYKIII